MSSYFKDIAKGVAPVAGQAAVSLVGTALLYRYLTRRPEAVTGVAKSVLSNVMIPHSEDQVERARETKVNRNYQPAKINGVVDVTEDAVIDLVSRGILTDMTQDAYEHRYDEVIFDPNFIMQVESTLNLPSGNRVLLTGSSQSGKTTFIQNLVLRILDGTARGTLSHTEKQGERPLGRRVFKLNEIHPDALTILAKKMGTTCIVVMDEAHQLLIPENMMTRFNVPGMNCSLSNRLKHLTNTSRTEGCLPPILAATNEPGHIEVDMALVNRFTSFRIPSRTAKSNLASLEKKLPSMIERYKRHYPQVNLTVEPDVLTPLIYLVPRFAMNKQIPNAEVAYLERIIEQATTKAIAEGRRDVTITKDSVLEVLARESGKTAAKLLKILNQQQDEAGGFPIPQELKPFLQDMTVDPDNFSTLATGRSEELGQVVRRLMGERTNNMVIGGPAGVGKTCLIQTLAYRLYLARSKGTKSPEEQTLVDSVSIPEKLINTRILTLRLNDLLSQGSAANLITGLIQAVKNTGHDVVLFIDEFHLLLEPARKDLLEALKADITSDGDRTKGRLIIIGASNMDEAIHAKFSSDTALSRRFATIGLREPQGNEMLEIAKRKYPDTIITEQVRKDVYRLKKHLQPGLADPDATLAELEKLKSWYEFKRGDAAASPIDRNVLQAYLEDEYTESWEDYWVPQLSEAPLIKSKTVERRLKGWEWISFKVGSLFNKIFRGEWSKTPMEKIEVEILVPANRPKPKRPTSGSKPIPAKLVDGVKDAADTLASSRLGGVLRMGGVDVRQIAGQLGHLADAV